MSIVLASTSPFRAAILKNAGLEFLTDANEIDERSVEAPLLQTGATPEDIASVLAEAKALDVSPRHPGAIVIGADQTLSLNGELLHKPLDMEAARRQVLRLSGKTHELNSAIVLVQNSAPLWRHVSVAHMHVRELTPQFVGRYLAQTGEIALKSVGAYQFEGAGIQLFDRVDGDYFTIVGLPILPLLTKLRALGEIDG
ncbi:Maf-like protein [Oricola cellulosilytica]|uniref:7-methyl-GTP pyrophosphatase n=1 Tax=Oricola cellulosilytica TaxID=1429082 RepID=A0A4R0PFW3_9HYPH|nr:Maf-like protein [Oricola cellulosilytica]TCD15988.1 Maf-like protein [Oricola cellulosilytica]